MKLSVKPLTPDRTDDFLYFFDFLAFTDNPHWATCYCYYYHYPADAKEQWMKRSAEENRAAAAKRIQEGKMNGYLAYADGKPVGWCHADALENFEKLKDRCEEENGRTAAVVCFIVAPEYRRRGVATALLQYLCADLKKKGFETVEAYPKVRGKTDAELYHGPIQMYEKEGFRLVGEEETAAVMRKDLRG